MPPAAFTSSRQNSEPRSCATESTLSGPVCETVMPMVMVSSPRASAGAASEKKNTNGSQTFLIRPPHVRLPLHAEYTGMDLPAFARVEKRLPDLLELGLHPQLVVRAHAHHDLLPGGARLEALVGELVEDL